MNTLIVTDQIASCPPHASTLRVVSARAYLTEPCYRNAARVINLCFPLTYQSIGYYVSLLAQARGQRPLPDVKTIEDLQAGNLAAMTRARLDCAMARALADAGVDADQQPSRQCPGSGRPARRRLFCAGRANYRPAVAILFDPACAEPPSNTAAINKFQQAAGALDMHAAVITRDDALRLREFDALFIRDTTSLKHYTYQLSRQAEADGLVVMDDPDSIIQCTNKVYLAELFARYRIATPASMIVGQQNLDRVIATLGLPCILKQPDGAFSMGVVKICSAQQLQETAAQLLQHSALILAQQYLPTAFDWRIGIVDRQLLFACKYFMAPGHWQIIKRQQDLKLCEGQAAAVPLSQVPACVRDTALAAAGLIGDGFYGVDLKQAGNRCHVIEVNDNPNVDLGNEDGVLQDALYRRVMQVFRQRIGQRPGRRA